MLEFIKNLFKSEEGGDVIWTVIIRTHVVN